MVKRSFIIGGAVLAVLVLAGIIAHRAHRRRLADRPRRDALAFAAQFEQTLSGENQLDVRDFVVVPGAYRSRTVPEQEEFLRKALTDEISPEGLEVLEREGEYGTLKEVFPERGENWARQFSVCADACVAFRAERNGLQAELVLFVTNGSHLIVRCNNVKQLASGMRRE